MLLINFTQDDTTLAAPKSSPMPATAPVSDIKEEMWKTLTANIPSQYYEISKIDDSDGGYSINVLYKKEPESIDVVDAQLTSVVSDVVHFLMSKGRHPFEEHLDIYAFASIEVRGVTGQKMYHPYGMASYNFNNDMINFKPDEH